MNRQKSVDILKLMLEIHLIGTYGYKKTRFLLNDLANMAEFVYGGLEMSKIVNPPRTKKKKSK